MSGSQGLNKNHKPIIRWRIKNVKYRTKAGKRSCYKKKAIDLKAAELTDQIMKEYVLDGTKMQKMHNDIMMLMGPIGPFEVNAWIFALENTVSGLKQTPAYSAYMVALFEEAYETTHTSYMGKHEQCMEMMEKLTGRKEAAE